MPSPLRMDNTARESYTPPEYGGITMNIENSYSYHTAFKHEGWSGAPKRKGKKRHLSRYHPSSIQPTSSSSPSTGSDSACTATKAFHCTVCPKAFKDIYGWKRHESSVHGHNDTQWTCMHDEIILIGMRCIFCLEVVKSMDHFDQHNIQFCLNKSSAERTFSRKDLLKQHVLHIHLAAADAPVRKMFKVPSAWSTNVDVSLEDSDAFWCGFCQCMLSTVTMRMEHVAEHFRNDTDMATWSPRQKIK